MIAPALVFVLSGCAAATQQASTVALVSERAAIAQCQPLGQIQSQSYWGGFAATGMAYNDAMNGLKNQAASRGGTHLMMVNSSNTMGGTNMIADAYRCG